MVEDVSSDSEVTPVEGWRKPLEDCLSRIVAAGHITSFRDLPCFTNPGLKIEGHPAIQLPLVERDAQAIKRVCRPAPFGKGDETLVDASVRKTWELDPTQFQMTNPAWPEYLEKMVQAAATDLGLQHVTAKPHKLLLYEPGSFFKRHKDSEKEARMVGTLIVCLPAQHEGGDVHASFGSEEKVMKTAPNSAFNMSALAWYSDVTHEVKELTSGYRLVLTYKIFQSGPLQLSATGIKRQHYQLENLICKWKTDYRYVDKLIYRLDHKYTKTSVSLSNMKGRDRAVCGALADIASRNGLYLFFAHITHSITEDTYEEELEDGDTQATAVFSVEGKEVLVNICIDDDELMGAHWNGERPDEEVEGEYTGNESMPSTFRYHHTAVFLLRKEDLPARMSGFPSYASTEPVLKNLIDMVHEDLKGGPINGAIAESALRVMSRALQYGAEDMPDVAYVISRWALAFGDDELFGKIIEPAAKAMEVMNSVGAAITEHLLKNHRGRENTINWDNWLDKLPLGTSYVSTETVMRNFSESLQDSALEMSLKAWRETAVERKMNDSQAQWKLEDYPFIVRSLYERHEDIPWIMTRLFPSLTSRGSRDLLFGVPGAISGSSYKFAGKTNEVYQGLLVSSGTKLFLRAEDLLQLSHRMGHETLSATRFFRMLMARGGEDDN